jgi:hypothetical protein
MIQVDQEDINSFNIKMIDLLICFLDGYMRIVFVEPFKGRLLKRVCISVDLRSFFSAMYFTY